jgi:hypothetical protein
MRSGNLRNQMPVGQVTRGGSAAVAACAAYLVSTTLPQDAQTADGAVARPYAVSALSTQMVQVHGNGQPIEIHKSNVLQGDGLAIRTGGGNIFRLC